ncbi:MAG: type I pullulanase, partial [Acholeplasmataceae bacterium]|nr:type I pullulanase [Acholeplasmataceae bacterium]
MKKIILLLLFFALLPIFGMNTYANDMPNKVFIHYYRFDETYTNYHAHLWEYLPASNPGTDKPFSPDANGWAVIELDLSVDFTTTTRLGIIIKNNIGWEPKVTYREPGGDRFIDFMTAPKNEHLEIHAYFIQGATGIAYSDFEIVEARFNTSGNIQIISTSVAESVQIFENETLVKTVVPSSIDFTVTMDGYDLSKSYKAVLHFPGEITSEMTVSIEALYDTNQFKNNYTYDGSLGVSYEDGHTVFRIWAPISQDVELNLYNQGHPNLDALGEPSNELTPYRVEPLNPIENGAWEVAIEGELYGKYYTFSVTNAGVTHEVVDPYAYSTGVNGMRGMIVDFKMTNPQGWLYNQRPQTITNHTDYIVYELHVRDLTTHSTWTGTESYRGKFLGLAESGTTHTNAQDVKVTTGLDHLVELGINAVQLLPIFDFGYVDEIRHDDPTYKDIFNWGYMPNNFNTLEGTFSTNPFDGKTRVEEFKHTVLELHKRNIRVIMDVVYNHTGASSNSNFHLIVPGYYHRMNATGGFSNGSGTGNETASDREMMRKFMVDSTIFWATEYNLSGFRFDLMELHDIETMNLIREAMDQIDPTIVLYGEPWKGGGSELSPTLAAGRNNIDELDRIGAFNDTTRDAIKGALDNADHGFLQGNTDPKILTKVAYGIVGGVSHPRVAGVEGGVWHFNPGQTINYVSAHDNLTLRDKLYVSGIQNDFVLRKMQQQANGIVLTSQ